MLVVKTIFFPVYFSIGIDSRVCGGDAIGGDEIRQLMGLVGCARDVTDVLLMAVSA